MFAILDAMNSRFSVCFKSSKKINFYEKRQFNKDKIVRKLSAALKMTEWRFIRQRQSVTGL
jgi:hypothetical protein